MRLWRWFVHWLRTRKCEVCGRRYSREMLELICDPRDKHAFAPDTYACLPCSEWYWDKVRRGELH